MFPLGEYLKKDVKKIAKEANLEIVVNKKESMGICFIGSRQFQNFIVEVQLVIIYVQKRSCSIVIMWFVSMLKRNLDTL